MGSLTLGRVFGIPIRVHVTLLLVLPLFAMNIAGALGIPLFGGLLLVAGLFGSVALHELGHAYESIRRGYGVRDIILTPIGGVALLKQSPRKSQDEFWIAIAGPLVSVGLAVGFGLVAGLFGSVLRWGPGYLGASVLGAVNLSLFLFNLLPCFPMDGGRIYRAWRMKTIGRLEATRSAVRLGRWLSFGLGFYGLFSGNVMLILIAIAVYWFAKLELRGVEMEEAPPRPPPWMFQGFPFGGSPFEGPGAGPGSGAGPRPPFEPGRQREITLDDDDVRVGPPPWRKP